MRLFVAVRTPPEVGVELRNAHVTLRFLGAVDDGLVDEVAAALEHGLAGFSPCEAELATSVRRLGRGAVVVPVRGLEPLAAAVGEAVGRYGGDDRPFRGHLTVARRRRGDPWPKATVSWSAPVRWLVEEVRLVRSELGRGEGGSARHTDVAVVALSGGSRG